MQSQHVIGSKNPRRIQRKGCFFVALRIVSWVLKATGVFLLCVAMIGFLIMFLRAAPELLGSIQYLGEQKMAGFVFFTLIGALLIFPVIGVVGIVLIIIGFILGYFGTEAMETKSVIENDNQITMNHPNTPPPK